MKQETKPCFFNKNLKTGISIVLRNFPLVGKKWENIDTQCKKVINHFHTKYCSFDQLSAQSKNVHTYQKAPYGLAEAYQRRQDMKKNQN